MIALAYIPPIPAVMPHDWKLTKYGDRIKPDRKKEQSPYLKKKGRS